MLKTKKFLAGVLSAVMIISLMPVSAFAASSRIPSGSGTADDPYQISNATQLKWFASKANSAEDKTALNAVLTDDIVLNEGEITGETVGASEWTPILNYNSTFDGQGHTISGVFVKDNASDYVGLFGSTDTEAIIENVGVINSYFEGYKYAGGIVGYSKASDIINCYNEADISTRETTEMSYTGGIVGYAYYYINLDTTKVQLCYNTGNISANATKDGYGGGIIGYSQGNKRNVISNCYNLGNIKAKGICSGISGFSSYTDINHCYNFGDLNLGSPNHISYPGEGNTGSINYSIYLEKSGLMSAYLTATKTTNQFTSGEVTYLLNNSITGASTWYQNIDMGTPDPYPVLDDSHYKVYYNSATDTYTNKRNSSDGFTTDDVYYNIDVNNGVLELEGEGAMVDYSDTNRAPWYESRNYIKEVKIYGDLIVDANAFDGMKNLETIYVDKGSAADDSSLYPTNVTIAYNDSEEVRPDDRAAILYGDVDGDGVLTILDATQLLKKLSDPNYILPVELPKNNS